LTVQLVLFEEFYELMVLVEKKEITLIRTEQLFPS